MRQGTIKGCIDPSSIDIEQVMNQKSDDYYINIAQKGLRKVNQASLPCYFLNTIEKSNVANEYTPLFQSKMKVEYHTLSVDKIIQGTSEFNPATPRASKFNKESSVLKAEIMIDSYKKGIKKTTVNHDFIATKKVNRTVVSSPKNEAK